MKKSHFSIVCSTAIKLLHKKSNLPSIFIFFLLLSATCSFSQNEQYTTRALATGLSQPWEITFGPDGYLWVTEANSYQVSRVHPVTGAVEMMLDLSAKKNFPNYNEADVWPQGGLQGMVFHPNFAGNPYIYLDYVYQLDTCLPDKQGCYFKTKIVRYNYNISTRQFTNEMVLIDTIPGSVDHNAGRLAIGPVAEGMDYLFYSIGDMGAGQLSNSERPHHGQNPEYYEGKILRFNLIPDTDPNVFDSWIPDNNPFNNEIRQSAVWSLGHRNPQGLAFSPNGTLYESEHGPYTDDEINIIKPSYNYGFPLIMGYTDGNYNGSRAGDGITMPDVGSEQANRDNIEMTYPYSDPIISLFAASQGDVSTFYNNDVNNTPPYDNYYLQYATSAPSGIEYYGSDGIPGWKNSLLVANLKLANVYRLQLSNDGSTVVGDTIVYFQNLGRFRDIAVSPDGTKIYVAADTVGAIKGAPGESVQPLNKGSIMEFTFSTTDVNDLVLRQAVQVSPNPATLNSTKLLISLENPAEVSADIYSIAGQKMTTLMFPQTGATFDQRIDLGQYEAGVYLLKVYINDETVVKKIVKM